MAFRKKINCRYEPTPYCGQFSEPQVKSVETGSGIEELTLSDVRVSELSKQSLPLIGLRHVLESGKVIDGSVSFAPSDPSNGLIVEKELENYFEEIQPQDQPQN